MRQISDDDLRACWKAHGGSFHGPNVETGTMPEALLLPLLRRLLTSVDELEVVCGNCSTTHVTCQASWFDQKKCCPDCTHTRRVPMPKWGQLLVECRDALPAITIAAARSRSIDLSLADRIEAVLEPWKTTPDDPDGR